MKFDFSIRQQLMGLVLVGVGFVVAVGGHCLMPLSALASTYLACLM